MWPSTSPLDFSVSTEHFFLCCQSVVGDRMWLNTAGLDLVNKLTKKNESPLFFAAAANQLEVRQCQDLFSMNCSPFTPHQCTNVKDFM